MNDEIKSSETKKEPIKKEPIKSEAPRSAGRPNLRKILLIILAVVVVAAIGTGVYYWLKKTERVRPIQDEVSRELPPNAATTRLNLPVSLSSLMVSSKKGLGGLGIDTDDTAKADSVWVDIAAGTQINSWASGQVTKINKIGESEYEVIINYSYGLWGKHLKLKEVLVKEGDLVREGQAVGKGSAGSQPNSDTATFALADENRNLGAKSSFSGGVIVAPLDYLKPDVKMFLLEKYK